ncbi:HAMP domain-containing protein [bacterium]|nr:HAMP domain-containing protein [bacterium]
MWQSLSISKKIWLSISILIIGYLASTGFGFILGRHTESRLNNVSEYLFSASSQSQFALSAFEEQIKLYNDLVMIGNIGNAIDASQEKSSHAQKALQTIVELEGIDLEMLNKISELRDELRIFTNSALAVYTKIGPDSEYIFESNDEAKNKLEDEIFLIGQQTNRIREKLTALANQFSGDLKAELAGISRITKQYRYLSMGLFLGNILIMVIIVSFILSRHVLTPIKRLTKGTQALSSLEFDTEIDVHTGDELGQLASNFNMMAQTLKRYEQMQRQWISDISHELRTPLSVLFCEIEALQDGIRKVNKEALDSLYSEAKHLNKIVEDLHTLSLAESKTLHFKKEKIDPLYVLNETIKVFQKRFSMRQISIKNDLKTDHDIIITGDPDRLKQVFSNILENALRYADTPGTLTISQYHTKAKLFLNLEDSGPGVPEESLDRLFDRLYRVDKSRSRAKGGSGLGLAISKNIILNHGGEIKASNASSGGLRIEIVLPLFSGQRAGKQSL